MEKIKLLLIEDDLKVVQDFKMYLESAIPNLEMQTAKFLEEIREKLEIDYDCIILDGELGDCGGIEVLEIMSEDQRKITILHSGNYGFVHNNKEIVFSGYLKRFASTQKNITMRNITEDIKKLALNLQ